jgi:hypothetical protein
VTAKNADELYLRFEREVRTPSERLPLDAFLPAPDNLPSAIALPAAAAPAPEEAPGATLSQLLGRSPEATPKGDDPPIRRKPRPRKSAEPTRSLEEEIADFLSQRGTALAPDSDPEK